jgi:putative transposase
MRELGIAGVSRRGKKRFGTTIPAKEASVAPDLVRRDFRPAGPDRLWVADIKYVATWQGYLFLACVLDAWSRKVVGWSMRDDLKAELVVDALGMAISRRQPKPRLVHHSDRGSQCTSLAFGRTMQEAGILPSMGRRGDAFDNALAESFFATLETESCSTARPSGCATKRGSRSSTGSKASTTAAGATPRSANKAHTATSR